MKNRNGFVSNSSSSSFVVIGTKEQEIPKLHSAYQNHRVLMIPQTFGGHYDFTESMESYDTFADRLNFAALVAWYKEGPGGYNMSNSDWTTMLEEVLIEDIDIDEIKINFVSDENYCQYLNPLSVTEGEIPHNSHPAHTPETCSMFRDKDTLRQWLYATDSRVTVQYD